MSSRWAWSVSPFCCLYIASYAESQYHESESPPRWSQVKSARMPSGSGSTNQSHSKASYSPRRIRSPSLLLSIAVTLESMPRSASHSLKKSTVSTEDFCSLRPNSRSVPSGLPSGIVRFPSAPFLYPASSSSCPALARSKVRACDAGGFQW